jgi:hypothetical protein
MAALVHLERIEESVRNRRKVPRPRSCPNPSRLHSLCGRDVGETLERNMAGRHRLQAIVADGVKCESGPRYDSTVVANNRRLPRLAMFRRFAEGVSGQCCARLRRESGLCSPREWASAPLDRRRATSSGLAIDGTPRSQPRAGSLRQSAWRLKQAGARGGDRIGMHPIPIASPLPILR